ncbi:Putative Stress response protein NST1 [[Torrubiella] hemipterigena]|uniref:Stress response protein NST1 n=1 Tax=[Torrubiella] hemipterigena TaxID=1531966 RepID=A0A0A1SPE7_9HYPO|nr:Putative Stress response protein NST1 [[Torrubiella] hemipterigena]
MPASNQKPASPTPASPRSTSKYTNKDGSKFITVPKGFSPDSSLPPTPTANIAPPLSNDHDHDAEDRPVNRKKQKRRQKAAAKAAALDSEQNGTSHAVIPPPSQPAVAARPNPAAVDNLDKNQSASAANGDPASSSKSKKNKKKKKKSAADAQTAQSVDDSPNPETSAEVTRGSGMSRDKIWSTSNHEERERIKEFWLGLGEDERKSLVKVEKDAVLRKMKEQQKHTCSCTVCGRKRTAIEEELEGLYDAYYLELEQFANQSDGPPLLGPPRDFPMRPPRGLRPGYVDQPPVRGRIVEQVGEDDEEEVEEVYSEADMDDEEFSDDEPPEAFHNPHDRDVADFLTFGNSLQVKGGILTVADDLLKNDGKRFIEMMEQLAERRMAREEDAREHFARGYGHPNGSYPAPHNHPPPEEDEYDEEEDEEDDYEDSQEEEYDDEEDQMTEEQRMEEGRRMFQIFAARMFEQRVLSAYKEKVAKERQQKLLEELEEESRQVDEQKAKKAKNAQKKKDKAAQRKQALAEEKAKKDAEKAAEEDARLAAEQKRVAEQKQKADEKRKQKEAQRKAEEDARLAKEAERQRRIHEQKEKQAEQERKARDAKEREKKLKEEQKLRDKEAREQKEREAQERKDKQDRDKRDKEARAAKAQRDAQEAADAKARAREEKGTHQQQRAVSTPHLPASQRPSVAIPPAMPPYPPMPINYGSPKIPIATPVLPKAPTPVRPRAASQQQEQGRAGSVTSHSGTSPNPSPSSATPAQISPGNIGQERKPSFGMSSAIPHSVSPPGFPSVQGSYPLPPLGLQSPPGLVQHTSGGFPTRLSQDPIYPVGFRPSPSTIMGPPGISPVGNRMPSSAMAPPGFDQFGMGQSFPIGKEGPPPGHSRQGSGSFDAPGSALPIGRPAPIGRPGSLSHATRRDDDSETKHLGSSALVDDDEPFGHDMHASNMRGPPITHRNVFGTSPFVDNGFPMGGHNLWGPSSATSQTFAPPGFGNGGWGAPPGMAPGGFGVAPGASAINPMRAASQPRHVALRLMLAQGCKDIVHAGKSDGNGYISLGLVKSLIDAQSGDPNITEQDLLDLCDTEGNSSNGGGTFDVRRGGDANRLIRWVPDIGDSPPQHRAVGAPGEIGSPLTGYTSMRGL